jgi:hypothetical protein
MYSSELDIPAPPSSRRSLPLSFIFVLVVTACVVSFTAFERKDQQLQPGYQFMLLPKDEVQMVNNPIVDTSLSGTGSIAAVEGGPASTKATPTTADSTTSTSSTSFPSSTNPSSTSSSSSSTSSTTARRQSKPRQPGSRHRKNEGLSAQQRPGCIRDSQGEYLSWLMFIYLFF